MLTLYTVPYFMTRYSQLVVTSTSVIIIISPVRQSSIGRRYSGKSSPVGCGLSHLVAVETNKVVVVQRWNALCDTI